MTGKRTIGFQADQGIAEEIESYHQWRRGEDEPLSETARELVRVGLRETRSPLLYRAKHAAIDAAFFLSVAAVVIVVIGAVSPVFDAGQSFLIAAVLLAVGGGFVALSELVRTLNGQTELSTLLALGRFE